MTEPMTDTRTRYVHHQPVRGDRPSFTAYETFEDARAAAIALGGNLMQIDDSPSDADAEARARYAWGWGGRDEVHVTHEGLTLTRPLAFPGVLDFHELFDASEPWSHDTMGHHGGVLRPEGKRVHERYCNFIGREEVGPFASVNLRQIGGPAHGFNLAVHARANVCERLAARVMEGGFGWQLIAHRREGKPDRVLVIAQHRYISGGVWVAYIDPATIPGVPEVLAA